MRRAGIIMPEGALLCSALLCSALGPNSNQLVPLLETIEPSPGPSHSQEDYLDFNINHRGILLLTLIEI